MKVLLIGSGGRESAIALKIQESNLLKELNIFPGNGGFSPNQVLPPDSFNLKDKSSVQSFIQKEKYDLVIIGPEEPLVDGISDWLEEISVPCFGPSKYCANLEGSKDFAKSLMKEFSVPTAKYETFTNYEDAIKYIKKESLPIVVKADGLAAGKGVTVCESYEIAENFLKEIFLDNKFGKSGTKVVIEEFLEGQEASIFAISDGEKFIILPALQDHKRAFDNDKGPNTGGMGAYCPAPIVNKKVEAQVRTEIFERMFRGLKTKGFPYKGLLYAGIMVNSSGYAKVVEFNCRFGDPETQALLLLIEDDLLKIFLEASKYSLSTNTIKLKNEYSSIVVLAAKGYPNDYAKNIPLELKNSDEVKIFHAGTKLDSNNKLQSTGGRILGIASTGKTLKESLDKNYKYLLENPIQDTFYRKDIGFRAL